jgi:hypothetical protein
MVTEPRHDDPTSPVLMLLHQPAKPQSSPHSAILREPSESETDNQATTFPANGPLLITLQRARREVH